MEQIINSITIKNLTASWTKDQIILKNINVSFNKGEFICLSGPNGSGKSTLLSILAGISNPSLFKTGTITICGKDISSYKRKELSRKIAYMCQNENCIWDFSVKEYILTGRFCHTRITGIYSKNDYEYVEKVIDELNIGFLAEKSVKELSGGEFQKVRIARSLCQNSDFILLDESVANLDYGYQKEILTFLKETCHSQNKGIIISIHDLNTACLFADKIALLGKNRKFIIGEVNDVINEKNLSDFYQTDFSIFTHPEFGIKQVYVK